MTSTTTSFDAAYSSATANPSSQFAEATSQCTLTPLLIYTEPFSNGWTYKHLMELVGGAAGAVALIICAFLIFTHLIVWVRPQEQKQIVRIILFAPMFVIFNFFALYDYAVAWILTPFAELYECFALVAMFYLLVVYVSPDEENRESFFDHLKHPKEYGGSLKWFQIAWVSVFQILFTKLIISLLQWILNAAMCPLKYEDSKASTAVSVVQSIVTAVCVMAIIRFERHLKSQMKHHHPLRKLITFKGVVGIVLLQTPIFTGLAQHRVFKGTQHVSILDFAVGTPSFLVCVEMFIVSLLFLWSFSASEYRHLKKAENLRGDGVGRAIVDSLNISDILQGCYYMVRIITGGGFGNRFASPSGGPLKDVDGYNDNATMGPPPVAQYPPPQYPPHQYQQGAHGPQRPNFQQ